MRLETVTRGRKLGLITFIESTSRIFGIFVLARSDKDEFQALDLGTDLGFVLVHYSWAGVLPLRVANIWNTTPLDNTDFSFACGYQCQIASWLGVGSYVHSPRSVLEHALDWTCPGLAHAAIVWVHLCTHLVLSEKYLFQGVIHPYFTFLLGNYIRALGIEIWLWKSGLNICIDIDVFRRILAFK